jgi:GMP synthase (glutamine-hydrolysing)
MQQVVIASEPRILIIDFGSQYTQLIARCIRSLRVYCEVLSLAQLQAYQADDPMVGGLILSGGPQSVSQQASFPKEALNHIWAFKCPILGICYGMQLMAKMHGGSVHAGNKREFGRAELEVDDAAWVAMFATQATVWMSHGDHVAQAGPGFLGNASTKGIPLAAMAHESKPWFGVQFHPEVTHTPAGKDFFAHFVFKHCQLQPQWTERHQLEVCQEAITSQVGVDDLVVLGLSGGVDSAVLAILLHQCIGSRLHCVFVDHGLLRLNEAQEVLAQFKDKLGLQVHAVDARSQFFAALKGVEDAEAKRKIIGAEFVAVFQQAAKKISGKVTWLAQGTIYPDVIESAGLKGESKNIKSHHNVGGLPEKLGFKLLEPLRCLFKDEVRLLGRTLGMDAKILGRHPFPGPGLAVRILGAITQEQVVVCQQADAIFIEMLRNSGYYDQISQAFAALFPLKAVGVLGDARQEGYIISLRAVNTEDFMTAHCSDLPQAWLLQVANRIVNEVDLVTRVVFDCTSKPPGTIEYH